MVDVTDLESGEEFTIDTEHAVLNIPTEASPTSPSVCFRDSVFYRLGGGGRRMIKAENDCECDSRSVISRLCLISRHDLASCPWHLPRGDFPRMFVACNHRPCWRLATRTTALRLRWVTSDDSITVQILLVPCKFVHFFVDGLLVTVAAVHTGCTW